MALSTHSNTTENKVWIAGQYRTASQTPDGSWVVVIDGKTVRLDEFTSIIDINRSLEEKAKNLTSVPESFINKGKEELAESILIRKNCEAGISALKGEQKSVSEELHAFLSKIGVDNLKDITNETQKKTAKAFNTQINGIKKNIRMLGAQFQYECLKALSINSSIANWQNSLALAQSAVSSILK